MIHNTLRKWYSGLDTAPPFLQHATPATHIQSTPQQTDVWTCGIHMLLDNLTTIYQGRIPTITHTQQNAESLSRSHLKYVITGELYVNVTNFVHNITNPIRSTRHNLRNRCNLHTQTAPNPNPKQNLPSQTTNTRKRPLNTTHTQHHLETPPQRPSNNPPKKTKNTLPPTPIPTHLYSVQQPLTPTTT
jgi:hypothetical protein